MGTEETIFWAKFDTNVKGFFAFFHYKTEAGRRNKYLSLTTEFEGRTVCYGTVFFPAKRAGHKSKMKNEDH